MHLFTYGFTNKMILIEKWRRKFKFSELPNFILEFINFVPNGPTPALISQIYKTNKIYLSWELWCSKTETP